MINLKCKFCGGALEIEDVNAKVVKCDYCDRTQTLPSLDNEKKLNLFARANRLRAANEFDKASGVYESIVAEFPEEAEAYWGLCLCKYGIEYVDDPVTGRKIPTCHRTAYESIFEDSDFEQACENADVVAQRVYRDEAKEIDRIQKGILDIVSREEPFDIFICYKETAEDGQRTVDSVIAQDVYDALVAKGYKVFFSRITLEDKLGQEYEPYIFSALNSAKVMLAFGTNFEYFNAVWVKNEWSRFLAMMQKNKDKVLIPCYRDIDAYDMPQEFKNLQGQDMGKVGAIQDLVRGIGKIIRPEQAVVKETVIQRTSSVNVENLIKRGNLALENKKWEDADKFFNDVLNEDAEETPAYIGLLCSEYQITEEANLIKLDKDYTVSENYKMACRFGGNDVEKRLFTYRLQHNYNEADKLLSRAKTTGDCNNAKKRFIQLGNFSDSPEKARMCDEKILQIRYREADLAMQSISCEDDSRKAQKLFESLGEYKDSREKANKCLEKAEDYVNKAEIIRKDRIYGEAIELFKMEESEYAIQQAISKFSSINGWENSSDYIIACERKIQEIRSKTEIQRRKKGKKERTKKVIIIITAAAMCAALFFVIIMVNYIIPTLRYNEAVSLYESKKYYEASKLFKELKNWSDSKQRYETSLIATLRNDSESSVLYYGHYEQDNDISNGKEDIEWLVLDREDDKVLVISRYALDCKQYNTSETNVSWERCSPRKWLNETFINNAFTADEKKLIRSITVTADKDPDKDTMDKLFLLNTDEVNKYFESDDARKCAPTDYAIAQGVYTDETYKVDGRATCLWWLRSNHDRFVDIVQEDGSIFDVPCVNSLAIRPAMWIDLSE